MYRLKLGATVDLVDADDAVKLREARELCRSGRGREIRCQSGLSLADIAAACEVDPATVLRWEQGKTVPQRRAALVYGRLMDRLAVEEETPA